MSSQDHATVSTENRSPRLASVDGRLYPLRSALVRSRAEGGLAFTTLVQEFHNPYAEPLEIIYTLPLPAEGAVLGYTITMGDRILRGEIAARETASERYREALYEGRTAALLEEDRPDTFRQRLGNVPGHTDIRVEIEGLQPLSFLAAVAGATPLWEFRFPTVVGVRYEGTPGRVTDAERLDIDRDPDGGIPTRFDLRLTIADDMARHGTVDSPSHDIVVTDSVAGQDIRLREGARLDRDLIVRWPAMTREVGVRMVEGGGVQGDAGRYALLTITPPSASGARYSRDLTVLIDSSGSMDGVPLELAKGVVTGLLRGLEDGDRFEVLAFSNRATRLTGGMTAATPKAVEKAIHAIAALGAGGGTEMAGALAEALKTLRGDSQRQVVLVTDGQIGFEREVVARVRNLPSGVRVHTVGIGSVPNRSLTAFLARAGRGFELNANNHETAGEATHRLRLATARPVLTGIQVTGSAVRGVAPAKPRDVMAGQPLVVAVELTPEGGTLEVAGHLAGQKGVWTWSAGVAPEKSADLAGQPGASSASLPIGAVYGREAVADLEAETGGDVADWRAIDRGIENLGLRHRITSRRTSFVAVLEEPTTDPLAPRRKQRLELEMPAGVSAEGTGLFHASRLGMPSFMKPLGSSSFLVRKTRLMGKEGAILRRRLLDELFDVTKLGSKPLQGQPVVLSGTIIHSEGPEIILEVQVPVDSFRLPEGPGEVRVGGQVVGEARLVPDKSSPSGPHAAGVLIRIALRMEGAEWPATSEIIFAGPEPVTLVAIREDNLKTDA